MFTRLQRSRLLITTALVAASLLTLVACASQPEADSEAVPETVPTATATRTPEPTPAPTETDPPTGAPFEVTITFEPTVSSGQLTITAVSNLPDGAELMTSLYSDAGYHGQDKALLIDGTAVFGPFSDDGASMAAGNYDFSISMSTASLQSASVRKYIGEQGQLMTGPLVIDSDVAGSSYVSLDTILTIE